MTGAEQGFLLLTSHLGNPDRKVLTGPQLRKLTQRAANMECTDPDRELTIRDLLELGYDRETAAHILSLLEDQQLLQYYLLRGKQAGCVPITRASRQYPSVLRVKLGPDCPGTLWAKGNLDLLEKPKIALVGSRDLQSDNAAFAQEVGRQAARQGYVLVSGNARGSDKLAQNACLEAGGQVISIVADNLSDHRSRENILFLSEDGYQEAFSPQRALRRNRLIHSMGQMTFVAQSGCRCGGTWDGTEKNLRFGWSPVLCFADDTPAQHLLSDMGAMVISMEDLQDFFHLISQNITLFDP